MVLHATLEIRQPFHKEHVHIDGRSRNGVLVPAVDYDKMLYRAEDPSSGDSCMIRIDRNAKNIPEDFQKGDLVEVDIVAFSISQDTPQLSVTAIRKVSKK